jgi:hypothetical protein
MATAPVVLAVAVENDGSCMAAIDYAIDFCQRLSNYKLYFVHAISQARIFIP